MRIRIFGKWYKVTVRKSERDNVVLQGKTIIITLRRKSASYLLKKFLANLLKQKLYALLNELLDNGKVEIFGKMRFKIVDKIDGKKYRVAKLKGNKILFKLNAIALPITALRYALAHELAHIATPKHSREFWRIVRKIYPSYRLGIRSLRRWKRLLVKDFNIQC